MTFFGNESVQNAMRGAISDIANSPARALKLLARADDIFVGARSIRNGKQFSV